MDIPCLVGAPLKNGMKILRKQHRYVLGRSNRCDVFLPHDKVSRQHSIIEGHDERFFISDSGSSNGTYVNAKKINGSTELNDGDLISIGPFEMTFQNRPQILQQASPGKTMADEPAEAGPKVLGEFDGDGLHEMCMFLESNGKSGVLYVRTKSGDIGKLGFLDGLICHAKFGKDEGQEIAIRIMEIPDGRYEFFDTEVPDFSGFEIKPTVMIMELLRQRDEGAHAPQLESEPVLMDTTPENQDISGGYADVTESTSPWDEYGDGFQTEMDIPDVQSLQIDEEATTVGRAEDYDYSPPADSTYLDDTGPPSPGMWALIEKTLLILMMIIMLVFIVDQLRFDGALWAMIREKIQLFLTNAAR